jgi:hypothetical protein
MIPHTIVLKPGLVVHRMSIMELADGLVTHETQYFADPFDPPPSRAGLAEPMPDRSG